MDGTNNEDCAANAEAPLVKNTTSQNVSYTTATTLENSMFVIEDEETNLEDWELFSNETNQLEYDEEELFYSTLSSSPNNYNAVSEENVVLNTDTGLNSNQALIRDEQLLIEGSKMRLHMYVFMY